MSKAITVTTLVENSVHIGRLKAEHGIAVHIQAGDSAILFDTGQSALLVDNATRLKIDLSKLDAIVLSHGHYDHTSGLAAVLEMAPRAKLFLHPAALKPKFVRDPDKSARSIGMPPLSTLAVDRSPDRLLLKHEPQEISPGIFSTGEIPRRAVFETPETSFFQDANVTTPDLIPDDQALFFESTQGIVVILGCAHAGVVNTLEHIRGLTNNKPFHAILGGMHLLKSDPSRIESTIGVLRQLDFKLIAAAHCTGALATAMFWNAFPGRTFQCSTGTVFTFEAI